MELLHKDLKDLEVAGSLRKLGNMQVMDWDFRTVLPAVNRLAQQEVDLVELVKRVANYKVLEWDFRIGSSHGPAKEKLSPAETRALVTRLEAFLQFLVVNLIDEPGHARLRVEEVVPTVFRFKLVVVSRDAAMLIGREGHTAAAIRSLLKAVARSHGLHALLEIRSHEQEMWEE